MLSDIGVMKVRDHFNLYVEGKAKGNDAEVGSLLLEHLTPDELYDAVEKIITFYAEKGKKRETFYKFLKRIDNNLLIDY